MGSGTCTIGDDRDTKMSKFQDSCIKYINAEGTSDYYVGSSWNSANLIETFSLAMQAIHRWSH